MLAVCGAYQLFGRYYRDGTGAELPGAAIFDLHTEHPGEDAKRCIGNIVIDWQSPQRHHRPSSASRTTAAARASARARSRSAACAAATATTAKTASKAPSTRNAIGTYIHGSLLPKNPALADHVLSLALRRRHPDITLAPIDDRAELRAHTAALRLKP